MENWTCKKCTLLLDTPFCPYCGEAAPADKPARKSRTRPNGAGNAYRRGRTWTARIVADWKIENGKALPIWRTKGGFKTKREALEYCQVLKTGKPKPVSPTLASYWQAYENGEFAQLSKSKQVAYRGAWKKLSALHHRRMDTFTVKDLREAVSAVAPTFYTARDCKTVLTRLFELAGADGTASRDLPSYIVLPKLKETERETFTMEEQSALWKLYEAGDLRAAIPLLMICTGMMPGEAMGLRVEHIDLEAQKITGAGMKTEVRKKAPVYIPEDAVPVIEDLIAHAQKTGYIWPRNEKRWYDDYYAALEAAACRRLEPYCCRHTTATRLGITEGIAPQTVQRVMRWSTTKMLDRYAHPSESDILTAANTITREML